MNQHDVNRSISKAAAGRRGRVWAAVAVAACMTLPLFPFTGAAGADPVSDLETLAASAVCSTLPATAALDCHAPGDKAWVARYDGPPGSRDQDLAWAQALSPDGSRVFVTGYSRGGTTWFDYATVAYDTTTGEELWVARFEGPNYDWAEAISVSPDGSTVFVTGREGVPPHGWYGYRTIAYDAATGEERWAALYEGPGNQKDRPLGLGVTPDGSTVVVTGESWGAGTGYDFATVAYEATTGNERWTTRFNGPGNGDDTANDLGISPDGATVFVTGLSAGAGTSHDYVTIAYDVADGSPLWVTRYDGPTSGWDVAWSLVVSPDGARVYVTGESRGTSDDYATLAYDAITGDELWLARYDGPAAGRDRGVAISVHLNASTVYVAGWSDGIGTSTDYGVVAYDAGAGEQLWAARHHSEGTSSDVANAVAVSPDGTQVIVTGWSSGGEDTVAYDPTDGSTLWVGRLDPPDHEDIRSSFVGYAVSVSPDSSRVYVTGRSEGRDTGNDFTTVAYETTMHVQPPL